MSTHQYVSFTTDFCKTPSLGCLPLNPSTDPTVYDVSNFVPENATEILIYLFITVRNNPEGVTRRSVYEVYTEDCAGRRYSQLMNVVFTKDNDFVMNSANLWLPLHGRKLFIRLPSEWAVPPPNPIKESGKTHSNLAEAMKDFTQESQDIFNEVFLLGYRN